MIGEEQGKEDQKVKDTRQKIYFILSKSRKESTSNPL
jgi:hypothetical protein